MRWDGSAERCWLASVSPSLSGEPCLDCTERRISTNSHQKETSIRILIKHVQKDLEQLKNTNDPEEARRIRKRITIKNTLIDTLMDRLEEEVLHGETEHGD